MASLIKRLNAYNLGMEPVMKDIKWKALGEGPFRFYRGTCHLFAQDFVKKYGSKPKVKSWVCGDLHFENFGSYKGENRLVYFDVSDFDEAILACPEIDLARFLTSVIIGAGQMKVAAISLNKALHDIVSDYVTTLLKGKALMLEAEVAHGEFKRYFEHLSTLDRDAFIDQHTFKQKGSLLLKEDNTHLMSLADDRKAKVYAGLAPLLKNSRFEHLVFEDAAIRIAGTGSLGRDRYCVLCYSKKKGKHYLIDVKEARQSCYKGLVKVKQPRFNNEAERINTAAYVMQFLPPAFSTTVKIDGKWYVVKEMQPTQDKMAIADFEGDFGSLSQVAREMAVLMGYAHIRSSGHLGASTADDLRAFAEKKQWQRDIIDLSGALAKSNTKYYKQFMSEGK